MADREPNRPKVPRWARISKTASLWALIILIPLVLVQVMEGRQPAAEPLTYTQFQAELDRGNVNKVALIEGTQVEGEFRTPIAGKQGEVSNFSTRLPVRDSEALVAELEERGVEISAREADRQWLSILGGRGMSRIRSLTNMNEPLSNPSSSRPSSGG